MNKSPTMLAVSRQYVWIKMAKYIYKLFLGCWTHCYSFPGRPTSEKSNVVDYFPREIGNYRNLTESILGRPLEKIARRERGIFVQFVLYFWRSQFYLYCKMFNIEWKKWMQLNDLTNHHEETFFVFTKFV